MNAAALLCVAILAAPISEQASNRAKELKANAKTFQLELIYNGEEDKPFYRLYVSVPSFNQLVNNPFEKIVQIKEAEASSLIDHLAADGFLDRAVDLRLVRLRPPTMPGYTLKVVTEQTPYYEDLGWGLPLIERLEALRTALPKTAHKDMDLLLGRLSGLRKQWEAEKKGD